MNKAFLLILIFMASACSSSQWRQQEFSDIRMGMKKSEVIEVAGPPHWSDRYRGLDRWAYYLEPGDRQTERVVYFKDGKVLQKGERNKPLLSAEEADSIKEPRPAKQKPFKPSMTEDQLRKEIKKEIKKAKKTKKKPRYESL